MPTEDLSTENKTQETKHVLYLASLPGAKVYLGNIHSLLEVPSLPAPNQDLPWFFNGARFL